MPHLFAIDDLADHDVEWVLARAQAHADRGGSGAAVAHPGSLVGLLFRSPSLRTRSGFAAAAARLGWAHLDVTEFRHRSEMSAPESFEDTVLTLRQMVDVLVVRTPTPFGSKFAAGSGASLVNGGSGGEAREHPTQALIDLAAIRRVGPVESLRIGIAGDLSARTTRSLVRLLGRCPPPELRLMGPKVPREVDMTAIGSVVHRLHHLDVGGLDVLYLPGLPAEVGGLAIDEATRAAFAIDADAVAELPATASVLSPLPVVDEIAPDVRNDARLRIWDQVRHGVFVRMAVLELVSGAATVDGAELARSPR